MHLKTVATDKNINWDSGYIKQSENELNEFEEAELEKALAEEALSASPEGEQKKPKKETPRPGSLFK